MSRKVGIPGYELAAKQMSKDVNTEKLIYTLHIKEVVTC